MPVSYANRATKAIEYMLRRLGTSATYYRLQAPGAWSPTGVTDIWWEQTGITTIAYGATTRDVEASGGRIRLEDKAFLFLTSVFTDQTDDEYIKFTSGSVEFTVGEVLTGATSGAIGTVVNWYENSGTWAAGTAVGAVWISTITGTFNASEIINGSVSGVIASTSINTSGGDDKKIPLAGDKIIYEGMTYNISMEQASADFKIGQIVKEDVTKSTHTVWARAENV